MGPDPEQTLADAHSTATFRGLRAPTSIFTQQDMIYRSNFCLGSLEKWEAV